MNIRSGIASILRAARREAPNLALGAGIGAYILALIPATVILFELLVTGATDPTRLGSGGSSTGGFGLGALLTAVIGAPFVVWATWIRHRALNFQKEGHITDRINKAVEQLGAEKTVKRRSKDGDGKDITIEETVPNIEVRIGALLSLERIAQDSTAYDKGRDHVRVMEILCAYVRENAPARSARNHDLGEWQPLKDDATDEDRAAHRKRFAEWFGEGKTLGKLREWIDTLPPPREDIALALRIIGRRTPAQRLAEARWGNVGPDAPWVFDIARKGLPDNPHDRALTRGKLDAFKLRLQDLIITLIGYAGYRLDLRNTNLQGTDLSHLVLSGALLSGARMDGANLFGARMEGADLGGARMKGADLTWARMEGADLSGARMEGADLSGARMEGADLSGARMDRSTVLTDATLRGASVRTVDYSSVPISADQVNAILGDGSVTLPPGMPWPPHWPRQELDWRDFQTQRDLWLANPTTYTPPPP